MNFEINPTVMTIIETALRDGKGRMHAFLSGGGLRVVRIDEPPPTGIPSGHVARTNNQRGKMLGYGEHPHVHEALRILADDLRAGCRPYGEVYGTEETHYFTGASTPHDELDAWIRKGSTFDARHEDGRFVFELTGLEEARTPPETIDRVANQSETIRWTDERGVTRVATPSRFPNGEPCCCVRVEAKPEGMTHHRTDMWYAQRTGIGVTLAEAIRTAFAAPKVELLDRD